MFYHQGESPATMALLARPIEATPATNHLLARQTRALEAIAALVATLTPQPPLEAQPDFIMAKRRLLEEAI